MARDAVLGFHRSVHEFLGSLLELLFGGLRIGVGWAGLVLYFDVDRLTVWTCLLLSSLLGLGGLVATIHSVIHHSASIERISVLLLLIVVRLTLDNRASDYSESTAVL